MFCDLVGSTTLSEQLDPEEMRAVMCAYQDVAATAIDRFGGHLAKYIGDGILAYFGYPEAHDEDAERAVRTAIDVRDALPALSDRLRNILGNGQTLGVRVGIHTGLVVAGEMGAGTKREELAIVGDTPNIAARLQAEVESGGIVVSHTTLRLIEGLFVTQGLGTRQLKGIKDPIEIHAVERVADVGGRGRATGPLTPLAGRERELGQVADRWRQVQEGYGQVIAISGEAGIGKSRLVQAVREQLAATPHTTLEVRCSPYASGSAFQPVIDLFAAGLGIEDADEPEARRSKLESALASLPGLAAAEVLPFLTALLGLPESIRYPLPHMGPELQREKTLHAMMAAILALEAQQPLLIIWEDLHWSDPSTLELLGRFIDQAPTIRVLHVLAYRPDFEPPWPLGRSYVCPLSLTRLTRADTRRIVESVASAGRLPTRLLDEVVARADGVPLFAEELARSVVDSGLVVEHEGIYEYHGRISDLAIPTTLQGSLMARLDRLSAAKQVAQLGATLGREFSYALVEAIADVDVPTLRNGLAQLVDAEIIYQRGVPPESSYTFKHALLQDTAYESQLRSRRKELHARIAQVLEEQFPQRVAAEPAIMARHCAEGELLPLAITYFQRAGEQAIARLSNAEGVEYFEHALGLVETLPASTERQHQEIGLRLALAGPLTSLHGYEDRRVVENLARVDTLCDEIGHGPDQLPALIGLSVYNTTRGNMPTASRYAERMLHIAEPLGITELSMAGHMIVGSAAITGSPIAVACEHLTKALALAELGTFPAPSAAYDMDPIGTAHMAAAIAFVLDGRPDEAGAEIDKGLVRAREVDHLNSLGSALLSAAIASYFLDDPDATQRYATECLERVRGLDFHTLESSALVFGGWARVELGDGDGVVQLEEGLALAERSGSMGGLVQLYMTAADTFLLVADYDRADAFVDRAADAIERTGERAAFEPQIPMFRAQILLDSGHSASGEIRKLVLDSIARWRAFGSRWMELRSAQLLGRLAQREGDTNGARSQLAALCDTLPTTSNAKRLREARALLAELG